MALYQLKRPLDATQLNQLAQQIKDWGQTLGFADIGISSIDLSAYEANYFNWLDQDYHGEMDYMAKHGYKRTRPNELEPGTQSIISVRMNYYDAQAHSPLAQLHQTDKAYISRYALHKDYHKLMRKRLQQLAAKIEEAVGADRFHYRAFSDSAPVLERPIAEQAGLGFIGKNSLIIHPRAGSWFFLGELYTNLNLPVDTPFEKQGCGPCTACIDECPTQAIVDNAVVDARRCISYLTIEYKGVIDEELRHLMGNRIYGCDDCQLVCPWNKFTQPTDETAFKSPHKQPPHALDAASLLALFGLSEADFLKRFEGSPIRRIGYEQWQRNLCIALGNATGHSTQYSQQVIQTLSQYQTDSDLVTEHMTWAVQKQQDYLHNVEHNTGHNTEHHTHSKPSKSCSKNTRPGIFKPFKALKYYLPKFKN